MDAETGHLDVLLDLEARHDDLLARLEELDKRVERVLAECVGSPERGSADGPPSTVAP